VLVFDHTPVTTAAEAVCASIKISVLNSFPFLHIFCIKSEKKSLKVLLTKQIIGSKFIKKDSFS
jgi:hypothetical protein